MNKSFIAAAVLAAVATSGSAYASNGGSPDGGHDAQAGSAAASDALATTVFSCDGGAGLGLKTRIVSSPFTFAETAVNDEDRAIPGAAVSVAGPASGTDTLLVTFSAETQLTGGDSQDWMGLEVKLDGVNINPFTAGSDKLAITGEPSWNLNSGQFCVKVRPGTHRLQAFTNLHDSNGSHTLSGWLDDYTFSVQRFN